MLSAKGGVGKSTLSLETAAGLQKKGYRTLIVDCDCQGSASVAAGLDIENEELKTFKSILDGDDINSVIKRNTPFGDIIANSLKMFNADRVYGPVLGAVRKLKKALAGIENDYDFVLLDCPPAFSFTTMSALIASDYVIVPQLASMFSLIALSQLKMITDLIIQEENPDLKILGIVLVRYNARTRFSKDMLTVLGEVTNDMNTTVFETKIRNAIAVEESITEHKSIYEYAPNTNISEDYEGFVNELLTKLNMPAEKVHGKAKKAK